MTTLYGIKNCDTVKKAQRFLTAAAVDFSFHDFRQQGIDLDLVKLFLAQIPLDKLLNKRSTTWKQLPDNSKENLTTESASTLLVEHPTLIKRPVLIHENTVHIGFNAKDYAGIFNL
jgi:Spx/MgsR family transcriptional regulator